MNAYAGMIKSRTSAVISSAVSTIVGRGLWPNIYGTGTQNTACNSGQYSTPMWGDTLHPTPMCCDVQKLHQSIQGWASNVIRLFCCNCCILAEIQSGRHVYSAHTLYLLRNQCMRHLLSCYASWYVCANSSSCKLTTCTTSFNVYFKKCRKWQHM